MRWASSLLGSLSLVLSWVLIGCGHQTIPNTDIRDTRMNREVVSFVEKYRKAVEARDIVSLIKMASDDYYDDNGTPRGEDDVDYRSLKKHLGAWHNSVLDVRYEIRYRRVSLDRDRILVDFTYTGSFRTGTPSGERWARRLADNRLILRYERGAGEYRIISGM